MTEKLVRDKVAKNARKKGVILVTRKAKKKEFRDKFLPEKLVEEAKEILAATTKKKRIEEIADLHAALDDYLAAHGISIVKVHAAQQRKHKKNGGFNMRTILVGEEGGE